jgi:hypothetical protein
MLRVCVTRFDNTSLNERELWKQTTNFNGTIYGTPTPINKTILQNEQLIVLEMNNTINKIIGIGLINNVIHIKKYKIYSHNNYNRYIYLSNKSIDTNIINTNDIFQKIEKILFYGKNNYKRGQGIQELPITAREIDNINVQRMINNILKNYLI